MTDKGTLTGKILDGRYEIKDRIGIGGMAEVYSAQDTTLGRIVAVKVMLPQFAADPAFTQRFRQEAAAAANLQSPYIVNVYDWGHDDGTYYIVMEFVRGSDLKTAILQRGAINQRKVAEIGSQVCQALTVAHNQDIIHRDIKPQNIMVQPDGNVKVMDFGIARAKNSVNDKTSAVLGTAHYISPEQAQGKDLTATSDVYSLGIVLYEAATGKLPFDGPDAVSVAMQQVKDEPVPPSQINPNIDPDLEDIIMVALAKNPADRFATANDMRIALNDYLAGRPVTLPANAHANMFTSANTQVIGGAGATSVMNGIGAGGTMGGTAVMPGVTEDMVNSRVNNSTTYKNPSQQKSSKKPLIIALVAVLAIALIGGISYVMLSSNSGETEAEQIAVPSVVGKTQTEAEFEITQAGLVVSVKTQVDETVTEGTVLSQDPAGGTNADRGSTVNLVVAVGPDETDIPNLTGMTVSDATAAAEAAGFKAVEAERQYSDTVAEGRVISTSPSTGSKAKPGSTIELIVSRGAETVSVPNVIGMTEDAARTTLQNQGFGFDIKARVYSDTQPEGCIIKQDPLNDKVKPGSTVSVTISMGPEPKEEESSSSSSSNSSSSNSNSSTTDSGSNSSDTSSGSSGSSDSSSSTN